MKAVGIKQLEARLSEYVRYAQAGETILVSDRDEVVAELGPARHRRAEPGSVEASLERLSEKGWLTRSGQPKAGWSWRPVSLGLSEDRARDLLADDRLRQAAGSG